MRRLRLTLRRIVGTFLPAKVVYLTLDDVIDEIESRVCRECGCTDAVACRDVLDQPCWWASRDLCSECLS